MTSTHLRRLAALILMLASSAVMAQNFSAQVMPPRFEASVKAGDTYRDVIEIQNVSNNPGHYLMRTADWTLDADGATQFEYALMPDSCRPWVGIEAPEVRLEANAVRRFRFEVAIPADAPAGECRFAVMIEGEPQLTASGLPVAGRIGVIVYLSIGDAAASMAVVRVEVREEEGREIPFLTVTNSGKAHGRLEGLIDGIDAVGKRWALVPAHDPILPGATRAIPLRPADDAGAGDAPPIAYPLAIKGSLDWGSQRIKIETTASR